MASKRNPLRDLTPTESDLDNNNTQGQGEKLREKATKSLHGPNANPSQLGDPVSLKAEASDNIPKPEEAGSRSSSSTPSFKSGGGSGSGSGTGEEKLREKAVKKLHGEGANPSQLGDPISLKAEQSDNVPTPGEEGAHSGQQQQGAKGRPSKL